MKRMEIREEEPDLEFAGLRYMSQKQRTIYGSSTRAGKGCVAKGVMERRD